MPDRPDDPTAKPAPTDPPPTVTLDQAPVVRWLIGLNLIVYGIDAGLTMIFKDPASGTTFGEVGMLTWFGSFKVVEGINQLQLWRLVTYQFLHGGLIHLGMNMMALFVFGPMVEKWWGGRRFLAFYVLCGACGAWLMALFAFFPNVVNAEKAWLVGASGSIFGVLVAAAMLYPKDEVKLMIPPMWVTIRKLAVVFIGLSIAAMFADVVFEKDFNFGGNAAHLGGALFGYLLVRRPWSLDFAGPAAPRLDPPGRGGVEGDGG